MAERYTVAVKVTNFFLEDVAQLAERRPVEANVVGSKPIRHPNFDQVSEFFNELGDLYVR